MTEMASMKGFDVFHEIPLAHCSQDDIDNAVDCRWAMRRKTPRKVRCRLVAHGCFQEDMDTDDTFLYSYSRHSSRPSSPVTVPLLVNDHL